MSLFGRTWNRLASYAAGGGGAAKPHLHEDANPYTARLGDVTVEAVVRRTPDLDKMLLYLGDAAWYGRYAAQLAFRDDEVMGKAGKRVGLHLPVNGDKLVFHWDGTPGVRINPQFVRDYPREDVTY